MGNNLIDLSNMTSLILVMKSVYFVKDRRVLFYKFLDNLFAKDCYIGKCCYVSNVQENINVKICFGTYGLF
jgi:hypothetical protein